MTGPAYRLVPELVPRPLHFRSAHRLLPPSVWRRIRAEVVAGGACDICGERPEKGLTCHERWDYEEAPKARGAWCVATLTGFECCCRRCSLAHHLGAASIIGPRAYADAMARLAAVNGIGASEASDLARRAWIEWRRRSERRWAQGVAPELVARYPELDGLFAQDRAS